MSSNIEKKKLKWDETFKCIIYGITINILGGLSYWKYLALKDILKHDFGVIFEEEVTEITFNFYNSFVIG
jgi:hypothetical protein